jgi:segregation and condensation protein A
MEYIDLMKDMRLELAAEYLVMAAMLAEIKSRMLLPRPVSEQGEEADPRAELVRRLQEYERYKAAAEDIDALDRLGRDVWQASADAGERKIVRLVPEVTLQEVLVAFKEVLARAEMFQHHHVQREALSVRQRMSEVLATLQDGEFHDFHELFDPEEGRVGVVVTFLAILEMLKDSLLEIVQAEPFSPLHVRVGRGEAPVIEDETQMQLDGSGVGEA